MNLFLLEIRRLSPRAALHGVLLGLCALLLVLYARMNSLFGLFSSLRFLLPSLPGMLLDILYLCCFLFAAASGAHALSFSDDPGSLEDRFSLPLSREQLALSCLAARLAALALFALCALAVLALGAAASGGALALCPVFPAVEVLGAMNTCCCRLRQDHESNARSLQYPRCENNEDGGRNRRRLRWGGSGRFSRRIIAGAAPRRETALSK